MPEPRRQAASAADGGNDSTRRFPDELAHLEAVKLALSKALRQSDESVERIDREYRAHQKYIADHRMELDPKEIFQNALSLTDMDRTGAFAVRLRDKLAGLLDSPYFARIDFQADGEDQPAPVYIGRFAFAEDAEDGDHTIYDWRAPIAGMFYDREPGRACYEAPAGRVEGELTRKRQFQISGGNMQYCLESAIRVGDDLLQRELSRTSDERMKAIIATIQKEQNAIIRNEQAQTLIIQGVAGSGKTSIALHRVAYLLYRQRDRLAAGNVVILSPNRVFGDYISQVLPELGEEPIRQMRFADLAAVQLDGVIGFAPAPDLLEGVDPALAARIRFKSTPDFLRRLDEYLAHAAERYFVPADYSHGDLTASAEYILERYRAYRKHPVKRRLAEVAEDVLGLFRDRNVFGEDLPQARTVGKCLAAMFRVKSSLALYRDFYRWLGAGDMLALPDKHTLEWADVAPFLHVHAAYQGLRENRIIRHLVIDEMQDYTPVEYAVLNRLFACRKTILGDCGQVADPCRCIALEDFRQLYPRAEIVSLTTSYRSSYEIVRFAGGVLGASDMRPVERHGDPVTLARCAGAREEAEAIRAKIRTFRQSEWATMGIIFKTRRQAEALYEQLRGEFGLHLLDEDSKTYAGGVSVTSVRMAKGLEFDEVVVAGADAASYAERFDRSLLYIACTRAMHRLSLTCHGRPARAVEEAMELAAQNST